MRALLPEYGVYCIASEALAGYAGIVVLIRKDCDPSLVTAPNAYGKSSPAIHVDTLGMDDFEARVLAVETSHLWIVCCYAPATGDEVRQKFRTDTWNPAFGRYLQ